MGLLEALEPIERPQVKEKERPELKTSHRSGKADYTSL
jgi:hypothetical protein